MHVWAGIYVGNKTKTLTGKTLKKQRLSADIWHLSVIIVNQKMYSRAALSWLNMYEYTLVSSSFKRAVLCPGKCLQKLIAS